VVAIQPDLFHEAPVHPVLQPGVMDMRKE